MYDYLCRLLTLTMADSQQRIKVLPRIITAGFANVMQIPVCDPYLKPNGTELANQVEGTTIFGCMHLNLRSVRLTTFSGEIHIHFDNRAGFPYFHGMTIGETGEALYNRSGSETGMSIGDMDLSGFSGASGVDDPEDEIEKELRADRLRQAAAEDGSLEDAELSE